VRSLEGHLRNAGVRIERLCFADVKLIASIYETETNLAQQGLGGDSGVASEQLWRELIDYGFQVNATDMHVLLEGRKGTIKYRINGDLVAPATHQKGVYTREELRDAIAYAYNKLHAEKTQQGAGFSEELDQQCMIPTRVGETAFNLRYQGDTLSSAYAVYVRYLTAKNLRMQRFQDAGYSDDHALMLETAVRAPFGATAIAGVTGSGKSTTLAFAIESILDAELLNIMTVESPVEYPIRGAKQITLQDGEQQTWRQTQKKLVRSDPDVLMISEVRCVHSGETAKTMSETGHPVFFTVHAGSVFTVFSRLCDPSIGFSMETLTTPGFWQLIVYQALVPVLCKCKLPARGQIDNVLDYIEHRFDGLSTDSMHIKNPDGCLECRHTGVIGQTVVAEMLQPDRALLELLRAGKLFDAEKLWRSRADGRFDSPDMRGKTVFQHALYKAFLGEIDPRVVERFTAFDRFEIL
jgi:type II secretory ATPase GspE/PulE/Tfp pilus assembly ATPase PilB-like protein